jgi:hypothetical protein
VEEKMQHESIVTNIPVQARQMISLKARLLPIKPKWRYGRKYRTYTNVKSSIIFFLKAHFQRRPMGILLPNQPK